MLKFKIVENIGFISFEAVILVVLASQASVSSSAYLFWGYFLSTLVLLLSILTISRAAFIVYFKYVQAKGVSFEEVEIEKKMTT